MKLALHHILLAYTATEPKARWIIQHVLNACCSDEWFMRPSAACGESWGGEGWGGGRIWMASATAVFSETKEPERATDTRRAERKGFARSSLRAVRRRASVWRDAARAAMTLTDWSWGADLSLTRTVGSYSSRLLSRSGEGWGGTRAAAHTNHLHLVCSLFELERSISGKLVVWYSLIVYPGNFRGCFAQSFGLSLLWSDGLWWGLNPEVRGASWLVQRLYLMQTEQFFGSFDVSVGLKKSHNDKKICFIDFKRFSQL